MRTTTLRSMVFATAFMVAAAANLRAQEAPTLLNSLEVQQLVARAQPADQARLALHFAALADQYAAESRQHEVMAQAYAGTTNRTLRASMKKHCERLATFDRDSATTLRELSRYYSRGGENQPVALPANAEAFQTGAGAPEPTAEEVRVLIARASTASDHESLAAHFEALAVRYDADAQDHQSMLTAYSSARSNPGPAHCKRLIKLANEAAAEARSASAVHTKLAMSLR